MPTQALLSNRLLLRIVALDFATLTCDRLHSPHHLRYAYGFVARRAAALKHELHLSSAKLLTPDTCISVLGRRHKQFTVRAFELGPVGHAELALAVVPVPAAAVGEFEIVVAEG